MSDKKVQLTNSGLKDMISDVPIYDFKIVANNGELEIEVEPLSGSQSYYNYVPNSLLAKTYTEFDLYLKRIKEVAKRNKINDKDKVFFMKNSKFPRTSFNRYSTKARLVQKTDKATKFVMNSDLSVYTSGENAFLVTSKDTKETMYFSINNRQLNQISHLFNSSNVAMYQSFLTQNKTYYSKTVLTKDIQPKIEEVIKKLNPAMTNITIKSEVVTMIACSSKPDIPTMELLLSGELPISSIVLDKAANDYIEQFRGDFDSGMYDYLVSTLGASGSDPEVPMQLLCNLKVDKFEPKLHALMLGLDRPAHYNLLQNRVMQTVDVKNFVKDNNLSCYFDYVMGDVDKMRKIGEILNKQDDLEKKKEFFTLAKGRLVHILEEYMNLESGSLKVSYEGIEI